MPFFAWKGINLKAQCCKGKQFASSASALETLLFKKDIALLDYKFAPQRWLKPVSAQAKIDYCMQLAMLLKTGMLLPEALQLVAEQMPTGKLSGIAYDVAAQVDQGIPLATAFFYHKNVFNPLIIQMVTIGQESSNLPISLQILTNHLESSLAFRNQIRSALTLPAVIFSFFLIVIALILTLIVPHFEALFASMHKELPSMTLRLIKISNFLRSWSMLTTIISVLIICMSIRIYYTTNKRNYAFDRLALRIPFVNTIILYKTLAGFFQSISLLLAGGISLIKAIAIAKEAISNQIIKQQITMVYEEVNAGKSFADSLGQSNNICDQQVLSLVKIGQESNMLPVILNRIADLYQAKLMLRFGRVNTLLGPFLLVILGLLITALIVALYTPIMSLSYMV